MGREEQYQIRNWFNPERVAEDSIMTEDHPLFTKEELSHIADKWQFWKGLALGVILSITGLAILGLFTNY
jgi:hypothetical protein